MTYPALSESEKIVFGAAYAARSQYWSDLGNQMYFEKARLEALPSAFPNCPQATLVLPWDRVDLGFGGDFGAWITQSALLDAFSAIDLARGSSAAALAFLTLQDPDKATLVEDFFTIPTP